MQITTPVTDTAALNRAELRRQRRRSKRHSIASAVTGVAGATLLITGATLAHPLAAQARGFETGTTIASTSVVGSTSTASAATSSGPDLAAAAKQTADGWADRTLARANTVLGSAAGKIDTAPLVASIASLANYPYLDATTVNTLTTAAVTTTAKAESDTAAADRAAAEAAAAAAAAEAQAQAEAEALAQVNTPDGAKSVARSMAASQYGWGDDQFQCLSNLWQKESGWNYQALNASSGATGIPQSLPGSKMASFGDDWETNAATQIAWGLDYISRGYGTPCAAWSHSQSVNWY